ncbi:MAG: TolC family protein [Planctomycetota bacterium]
MPDPRLATFLACFACCAAGATAEPLQLDAEAAARLARERSELVLAARGEAAAIRSDSRVADAFAWPALHANARYTHIGDSPEAIDPTTGAPSQVIASDDYYRAGIELRQLLWSFGRHAAAGQRRAADTARAQSQIELAERDIAYQARIAVEAVRLARARLGVAEDRLEQRRGELEDARERRAAGTVTDLDVRQSRLRVLAALDQHDEAERTRRVALLDLAAAVAMDADAIAVSGELARPATITELFTTVRERIEAGSELRQLRAQLRAQHAAVTTNRALQLPELYADGSWYLEGPESDDLDSGWSVGLGVQWNLYAGGATMARREAARHRVRALRQRAIALIRDRNRLLAQAEARAVVLASRIERAVEAVELAEANYQQARSSYRAGTITLTRLGETSLAVAEARYALVQLVHAESVLAHDLRRLAR